MHCARDWNTRIREALSEVGIVAEPATAPRGFLEGVRIHQGRLFYDAEAPPSNLLHEAGHLACIPPDFRPSAQDDLRRVFRLMGEAYRTRYEETGNPDDPLMRAIVQCSDPEATAWAWAFGRRIGIPTEMAILDHEYDGAGEDVRIQLSNRMHCGINGLRAAGMIGSVREYPTLSKWVQDAV